ncbi:Protein seele, partial [Frankliniella fusca]
IPYALSEMHLSDSLETVCKGIDDYVRATRKDTGDLTLLKLIVDGKMNPDMSEVDIIQDGDLNKSLKYYCDGIVEEYEEDIVRLFQKKETAVEDKLCQDVTKLCKSDTSSHDDL